MGRHRRNQRVERGLLGRGELRVLESGKQRRELGEQRIQRRVDRRQLGNVVGDGGKGFKSIVAMKLASLFKRTTICCNSASIRPRLASAPFPAW